MTSTLAKRDEELKNVLKTLSEHTMDKETYTEEERFIMMDVVLQLIRMWRQRL